MQKNKKEQRRIDKNALIKEIANRANFNLGDVRIIIDTLIDVLEDAVFYKWDFNVRSLGRLVYTPFKATKKRVPINGKLEEIDVAASERVMFVPAKNIRRKARLRLDLEGEE